PGSGEVRALCQRFPARPLGRLGGEAHHARVRRARARRPQVPHGAAPAAAGRLMPHVVLGVSGGIACYKSCTLARRLTEAGMTVEDRKSTRLNSSHSQISYAVF